MTIKHLLCYIALALLTLSCNHVFKEYNNSSFPSYIWKTGVVVPFTPEIKDTSKSYNLILGIRHVASFPLDEISLNIKTVSPSGKETKKDYIIKIRDASGKELSDCAGDMCDIETVIESMKFDEVGEYKYFVTHNVKTEKLPGIMEIGLIIDEKE